MKVSVGCGGLHSELDPQTQRGTSQQSWAAVAWWWGMSLRPMMFRPLWLKSVPCLGDEAWSKPELQLPLFLTDHPIMGPTHTELLRSEAANPGKEKWFIYACEAVPFGTSLQGVRKQWKVNTRTGFLFLYQDKANCFTEDLSLPESDSFTMSMLCSRHISTKLIIYWNQGMGRSSLSYIQDFLFVMRTLPPSLSPHCCSPSSSELGQTWGSVFAKKAH